MVMTAADTRNHYLSAAIQDRRRQAGRSKPDDQTARAARDFLPAALQVHEHRLAFNSPCPASHSLARPARRPAIVAAAAGGGMFCPM